MKKNIFWVIMVFFVLQGVWASFSIGQTSDEVDSSQASSTTGTDGSLAEENNARIAELEQKIEEIAQADDLKERSLMSRALISCVLILVGVVFFIVLKIAIRKFEEVISEKGAIRESEQTLRLKTIGRLFHWVGSLAIVCAVLYMILENFGVNVAPLLAGAGIVGLAFGFGGQYLIRDLINGIFILLEGHFSVNDVVKIGEFAGVVESINLRITTLRDAEGRVIIIPNGEIKAVINLTKEYSRAVLSIGVAYKENVDRVMEVIKQVGKEIRKDEYFGKLIIEDLEMLGVDDFADSQVVIKFRVKTLPIKQWEVARELRRRIKNRFDELVIEIPFPHRTLYWGSGQDNAWFRELVKFQADGKTSS